MDGLLVTRVTHDIYSNVLVFRYLVGKMVHFWVWVAEYELRWF